MKRNNFDQQLKGDLFISCSDQEILSCSFMFFFSFGLFFCHSVLFVRLSIRPVCLFVSVCIVFFLSLLILTFSLCFSLNPYIPISLFPTFSLLFPPRHPTLSPLPPSLSLLIILLHFPVSISLFPHTIISR